MEEGSRLAARHSAMVEKLRSRKQGDGESEITSGLSFAEASARKATQTQSEIKQKEIEAKSQLARRRGSLDMNEKWKRDLNKAEAEKSHFKSSPQLPPPAQAPSLPKKSLSKLFAVLGSDGSSVTSKWPSPSTMPPQPPLPLVDVAVDETEKADAPDVAASASASDSAAGNDLVGTTSGVQANDGAAVDPAPVVEKELVSSTEALKANETDVAVGTQEATTITTDATFSDGADITSAVSDKGIVSTEGGPENPGNEDPICNVKRADAASDNVVDESSVVELMSVSEPETANVPRVEWFQGWDETHSVYYYFNATTKESTWSPPEAPFVPCGEDGSSSEEEEEDDEEEGTDDEPQNKVASVSGEVGTSDEVELSSMAWIPSQLDERQCRSLVGEILFNEDEFKRVSAATAQALAPTVNRGQLLSMVGEQLEFEIDEARFQRLARSLNPEGHAGELGLVVRSAADFKDIFLELLFDEAKFFPTE